MRGGCRRATVPAVASSTAPVTSAFCGLAADCCLVNAHPTSSWASSGGAGGAPPPLPLPPAATKCSCCIPFVAAGAVTRADATAFMRTLSTAPRGVRLQSLPLRFWGGVAPQGGPTVNAGAFGSPHTKQYLPPSAVDQHVDKFVGMVAEAVTARHGLTAVLRPPG